MSVDLKSFPKDFHLIETMRHSGRGEIKSMDLHLGRAEDSAAFFGFRFDLKKIQSALSDRLASTHIASRVRLLVYPDGEFLILDSDLSTPQHIPLRLALHPDPMLSSNYLSTHKTSIRDPYSTRLATYPGFDDVVVQNERKEIMETCTSNIAVKVGEVWFTPKITSGCLPGIERKRLLGGGKLREQNFTAEFLRGATEVAVLNSLRGWRPAYLADQPADLGAIPTA